MKTYNNLHVKISYHVCDAEGETAHEAVMNSIEGYDGEIMDIDIISGEKDFEEDED